MPARKMTIQEINAEAKRRAPNDKKAQKHIKALLRKENGYAKQKRKRGGVAGVWDRNKKIIKPVVNATAGAFFGPWGGAASGALMEGLDQEGKAGINFDGKDALKGGLTGYWQGGLGESVKERVGQKLLPKLFGAESAGSGAAAAAPEKIGQLASASPGESGNMVGNLMSRGAEVPPPPSFPSLPAGGKPSLPTLPGGNPFSGMSGPKAPPTGFLGKVGQAAKGIGMGAVNFAKAAPEAVGGALQGYGNMRAANTMAASQASRDKLEREMWETEQEAKKKRAAMAQQLYQVMQGQMSWNKPPQGGGAQGGGL